MNKYDYKNAQFSQKLASNPQIAICCEMIDRAFGEIIDDMPNSQSEFVICFQLLEGIVQTIEAQVYPEQSYTFEWKSEYKILCEVISIELQKDESARSADKLLLKRKCAGTWHAAIKYENDASRTAFRHEIQDQLTQMRSQWLSEQLGGVEIYGGTFNYPSMHRPFRPIWPGATFGYFFAISEPYVWIMSNGLSNPKLDEDLHLGTGLGCELLAKYKLSSFDFTNVDQLKTILDHPHFVLFDAICGSLVLELTKKPNNENTACKSGMKLALHYEDFAGRRPIASNTPILLSNAATLNTFEPINLLADNQADPFLVNIIHDDYTKFDPDEIIAQYEKLDATQLLGQLPDSYEYEDQLFEEHILTLAKAEIQQCGTIKDNAIAKRLQNFAALEFLCGRTLNQELTSHIKALDLSIHNNPFQKVKQWNDIACDHSADVTESVNLSLLDAYPELLTLDLRGLSDCDLQLLAPLQKLEELQIDEIPNINPSRLPSLPSLKKLYGWSPESINPLLHCKKLHTLFLTGQVNDLSKLASFDQLRELSIHGCTLKTLQTLPRLSNLEIFYLNCSEMSRIDQLPELPKLTRLIAWESDLETLSGIERFNNLELLNVRDTNISNWGNTSHIKKVIKD